MSEERKYEVLSAIDEAVGILHRGDDGVDIFYRAETLERLVNAYRSLKASKIYFQPIFEDMVTLH